MQQSTAVPKNESEHNTFEGTVGQKTAARNPFFSIFVAYILPQWYKLPLFLHSRFPTCLEKSERV